MSSSRLLEAYRRGIFPWYSAGHPILWWSPNPRTVLYVDEFKVPRSLLKVARQKRFELRVNTDFAGVIRACAGPRTNAGGTWITGAVLDAYTELNHLGYAHSVESWRDGRLVGGLYGVTIGRMFFGESMFAREADASKIALMRLVSLLHNMGMPLIDCQQETAHMARFGARPVARQLFAAEVSRLVNSSHSPGAWTAAGAAAICQ